MRRSSICLIRFFSWRETASGRDEGEAKGAARRVPHTNREKDLQSALDVGRYTGPLPEGRNSMAELVRLARPSDLAAVAVEYYDICARWPESEHDGLVKGIWTWLGQVHFPMHGIERELPELVNVREAGTMMLQVVDDWSAKLKAEGRTEGQAAVICRLAARKFGPETANRLAERLAETPDPERLGEVGEWLLECGSGEELLDRVARLCETVTTEDCASQG